MMNLNEEPTIKALIESDGQVFFQAIFRLVVNNNFGGSPFDLLFCLFWNWRCGWLRERWQLSQGSVVKVVSITFGVFILSSTGKAYSFFDPTSLPIQILTANPSVSMSWGFIGSLGKAVRGVIVSPEKMVLVKSQEFVGSPGKVASYKCREFVGSLGKVAIYKS